jgi:hypothetical protein
MQNLVVVSRDVQRGKVLTKVRGRHQQNLLLLEQLLKAATRVREPVKRTSTQMEICMLLQAAVQADNVLDMVCRFLGVGVQVVDRMSRHRLDQGKCLCTLLKLLELDSKPSTVLLKIRLCIRRLQGQKVFRGHQVVHIDARLSKIAVILTMLRSNII